MEVIDEPVALVLTRKPTASPTGITANLPSVEYEALYDFYNSTGGEHWNWNVTVTKDKIEGIRWNFSDPDANPCTQNWDGILCSCSPSSCHVQELSLPRHNVTGALPPSLSGLEGLVTLTLATNHLHSSLPGELYGISTLQSLDLRGNHLQGTLSNDIIQWQNIKLLNLSVNHFYGTLPSSFYNLTSLQYLDLGENNFAGTIDNRIGDMVNLKELWLLNNSFTGPIPSRIGELTRLTRIFLRFNELTSTVPASIFNPALLLIVDVGHNRLTGSLPSLTNARCRGLLAYHMDSNLLTGTFPEGLTSFPALLSIFIYNNFLTSTLPESITQLTSLLEFTIRFNLMTGTIPSGMESMETMDLIGVQYNAFSGSAKPLYANKPLLVALEISGNFFEGPMPYVEYNVSRLLSIYDIAYNLYGGELVEYFVSSKVMSFINLQGNAFSGTIPSWLSKFELMSYFNLADNIFTGSISSEFMINTFNLAELLLNDNQFTGTLPTIMGQLYDLAQLDISNNKFSGTLPDIFINLGRLRTLSLAGNNFRGPIGPLSYLGNMQYLANLDISDNALTGTLSSEMFSTAPVIQAIVMSSNCLSGTIPESVCTSMTLLNLIMDGLSTAEKCQEPVFPSYVPYFTSFTLSRSMSGTLPNCIFSMPNIQSIHVSGNGLVGSLSSDLNISESLMELSLSHNSLTHTIPDVIQRRSWISLDLSYNKLGGTISNHIALFNHNTSSLSLEVNRISGNIPSNLLHANEITILDGNIFDCGLQKKELPEHDPDRSQYSCGSDAINAAVGSWVLLVVLSGLCVAFVIIRIIRKRSLHSNYKAEDKFDVPKRTITMLSDGTPHIGSRVKSETTSPKRGSANWWQDARNFYLDIQNYVLLQSNEFRRCFEDISHSKLAATSVIPGEKYFPLLVFDKLLSSIRSVFLNIALIACVFLLPIYSGLSIYESIYYYSYAWQISAILLSGYVSGIVLIIVFFAIITSTVYFFVTKVISLYLALHHKERVKDDVDTSNNDVDDNKASMSSIQSGDTKSSASSIIASTITASIFKISNLSTHFTMSPHKQRLVIDWLVAIGFGVINFTVMIMIDIIYVEAVLSQNGRTVFIVQVLLSMFKVLWNEVVLWTLYPLIKGLLARVTGKQTFVQQEVPAVNSDDSILTPTVGQISAQRAVTSHNHDWLRRQDVSYLVFTVILNNVVIPCISIAIISSNCFYNALFAEPPHEDTTVYTCNYYATVGIFKKCLSSSSSTEETSFNTPFYYRYQCSSAFVMNFAAVHIFMFILVGLLLPALKLLMKSMYEWSRKTDAEGDKLDFKKICRMLVARLLPYTLQDPLPLRPTHIPEASADTMTLYAEDVRYFYKEKLVVRLSAYLSIVLTFGVLFPPLAVIGSVAVYTTTYFEQYCISVFLSTIRNSNSSDEVNNGKNYNVFHLLIERDCHGVVRLWYGVLWLFAPFASLLYAWIIFDTIGDKHGWLAGFIPAICMFALPFVCFFTVHYLQKYRWIAVDQILYNRALDEEVRQYSRQVSSGPGGAIGAGGQTSWRVFSTATFSSALSGLKSRAASIMEGPDNIPNPLHGDEFDGSEDVVDNVGVENYRDRVTSIQMTARRSTAGVK